VDGSIRAANTSRGNTLWERVAHSVAAVLTAAVLASGSGLCVSLLTAQSAQAASTQSEIDTAIAQILRETNAERAKAGLKPLLLAAKINAVAQGWSEYMAAEHTMYHNPVYQLTLPKPWIRIGENVGQGYTTNTIVAAWMASQGHRANILGDFTHIGLGYWVDETGRAWFTQNFGKYVIPDPTIINDPVTKVGKVDFTSTWPLKWWEPKYDYYVELRASDRSLLQTQTVMQPAVSFTGLAGDTTYTVEVTARAVDVLGETYLSPVKSYSVTTLKDVPDITPPAVTFTDVDGTQSDTFTIPEATGLDYLVNGTVTPPGAYLGKGTVTVTVQAQPGYVLAEAAATTWSALFKETPYIAIPEAVSFTDLDGIWNDTVTIPSVAGVDYLLGGNVVAAGPRWALGTVTVTARAQPDYVLAADTPKSWSATFKDTPYTATPAWVQFTDVDGTQNDTYFIPAATGVEYLVDGNIAPAGTYPGTGTVTVAARAKRDYVLSVGSTTSWSKTFKATPYTVTPAPITFIDVDGTQNDTFTIPTVAGVDYVVGGSVQPAGTYPGTGTVTVTAQAQPSFVLAPGSATTWTTTFRGALIAAVPKITGTAKVGYTLTVNPGVWDPAPVSLSYQWYRAGVAIAGATGATYNPTVADVTKALTARVTGSREGYGSSAQTSLATTAVANGSLIGAVPRITGTAQVGYTLTAIAGAWGPAPVTLSYQWYRSGTPIAGATAATYRAAATDVARSLSARVTGAKAGYATTSQASPATAAVASGSLAGAVPRITGPAKVGYSLTAVPGIWGPAPVTLRYQWYRSGAAITGATAATYRPGAADIAKSLSVRVIGAKAGYSNTVKASAGTAAVAKGALGAPVPRILGAARVGYTLTAVPGTWTPAPVTLRYQWYRSGVAIPVATRATYKPTAADLGKTLTIRVTGSKAGYAAATKPSAVTRVVVR
jgi:uncharacterized protein YkwD